ncbi:halovibrin HvnA, partial [Pseudomonas lini]
MKEVIALMLMVVLTGCQVREQQQQQQQQQQQPAPTEQAPMAVQAESGIASTANSTAISGAAVAANLTTQYNDTRPDCGKPSMPAFLCRGVTMRSTVASNDYSSWNPSPHSQTSGGVSFSYLSKDAKFTGLVFGQKNGFIFYPV